MGFIVRWVVRLSLVFLLLTAVLVVPLRWLDPPGSMLMLVRYIEQEGRMSIRHQWRDLHQLPRHLALAVVVAEDQRFLQHPGVDLAAVSKALAERHRRAELRGASTLTQQVAKNIYLWNGRSWLRKALEAWLALWIDLCWGKGRVMEMYLNVAEWGPGVFGAAAASRYHFGVEPEQLTVQQSALLASALPSPLVFRPSAPNGYLVERAQWNLAQQRKLGGQSWISRLYK